MILKKISCHILCYNLILQSTISSFFAFLFLVERSNMRQFDTVKKKISTDLFFNTGSSNILQILFTGALCLYLKCIKKKYMHGSRNSSRGIWCVSKDNMKFTVYFKLWCYFIYVILRTFKMIMTKCNIVRFSYFIINKYKYHWYFFICLHSYTIIFSYIYTIM